MLTSSILQKNRLFKTEQLKTEQLKTEQLKTELSKTEQLKTEQLKTEQLKTEQLKTELLNNKGLTLVEVIMTLAILGVVICPLMNMLILSHKITGISENEYRVIQTAQYYMEEIRAMDDINLGGFVYNSEEMCYERIVFDVLDDCNAQIHIREGSYGLYYIEVDILRDGEEVNSLVGSIIFK